MEPVYRRFALIVALIAATLAVGTTGFALIEHYPVFDAFYMSLITITTVGYEEIHPLSFAGRIFNSFLLLFGVGVMFYAVGAITQTVLETEFDEVLKKRRTKKMIELLRDHYILCGFGRVGRGAATELQRTGVKFLVMEKDEDRVEWAIKSGFLAVLADSTRDDMLHEAGVTRAKGLIAALATDADNLFLILSAKSLNPNLRVSSRVSEEGSEAKMRRAGADSVFMPYSITGYRLAQSLLRPHVFEFLDVTAETSNLGLNVGIEQVEIGRGGHFEPRTLNEMHLRKEMSIIALAIRRKSGEMVFNPVKQETVQSGDWLIVMGRNEDVRKLEKIVAGG